MKRIFLAIAALAAPLFAAGTVTEAITPLGNSSNYVIIFSWTGDATAGTVPITAATGVCDGRILVCTNGQSALTPLAGLYVLGVETAPGAPNPTNGYSVQIQDKAGADILAGAAVFVSSTIGQAWTVSTTAPPLTTAGISLVLTGQAVAAAKGTVYVFVGPTPVARNTGGGGGGSGIWGGITGVITNQTDLATALNNRLGINANAVSASALALTPTQCAGGSIATGIQATGNANCTNNAPTASALAGTPTICTGGQVAEGITPLGNASCTGVINTASALAATPMQCSAGNFPLGIAANGNAQTCTPNGGGGTGNTGSNTLYIVGASISLTCPSSTAGTVVLFEPSTAGGGAALSANATTALTGCTGSSSLSSDITLVAVQATSPSGPFTLAVPAGFDACQMGQGSASITTMKWSYDGTVGHLNSCQTSGQGSLTETAAPSGTPLAGSEFPWTDSTGLFPRWKNSMGTIFGAAKEGTGVRIGGGANTADSFITPDTNTAHALCGGSPPAFGTSCGGGSTMTTGGVWPFGPGDTSATMVAGKAANVVLCFEWTPTSTMNLANIEGLQYGGFSDHMAWAVYSQAGALLSGSATVATSATSNAPWLAAFSATTLTGNTPYEFCETADNSAVVILGLYDSGPYASLILYQGGSYVRLFTAANPSTGTTTLAFPSTLGTRTVAAWGSAATYPLVFFSAQ